MKRDSFIFYQSFYEAIVELPREVQGEVLTAIVEYGLYGETTEPLKPIAKAMMLLIKPQIDANQKRYENGCKGGRPRKDIEEQNQKETKRKPNDNDNVNVNDNVSLSNDGERERKKKILLNLYKKGLAGQALKEEYERFTAYYSTKDVKNYENLSVLWEPKCGCVSQNFNERVAKIFENVCDDERVLFEGRYDFSDECQIVYCSKEFYEFFESKVAPKSFELGYLSNLNYSLK
ncbi:MAG: hypothetical protein J6V35_03605 [Bacteroidales bacterium]|nr:hypothetical protein [Bacteroidales bacterium]